MPLSNETLQLPVGQAQWEIPFVLIVWGLAYLVAVAGSGWFVRWVLHRAGFRPGAQDPGHRTPPDQDAGVYIGKLEDVLVVTFVAIGEFTAPALVFAAKGIIRAKDGTFASYYLLGTLANFTWALCVALLARWALGLG